MRRYPLYIAGGTTVEFIPKHGHGIDSPIVCTTGRMDEHNRNANIWPASGTWWTEESDDIEHVTCWWCKFENRTGSKEIPRKFSS